MKQQSLPRSYLTELRGREFKGIAPLSQPKAETFLQQKFLFTTTLNFAKVSTYEIFLSLGNFRLSRGTTGGQNGRKSANIEVKNQKSAKIDEIIND